MSTPVSIRSRLLLLVLATLLPMVVIALWLVLRTYESERVAVDGNLRDTTRALSLLVDQELTQRATIARVLALSLSSDVTPPLTKAARADFERQARLAMAGLAGSVELRTAETDLVDTRLPDGTVPRPGPGAALYQQSTVGPLEASPYDGVMRTVLVEPVRHQNKTVMNLSVTILPVELQSIIDHQRLPAGWVGTVLDAQGTVVARYPGGAALAGRVATEDMKRRIAAGTEGPFESSSMEGEPVVGYFSRSARGWTYITAMPQPALGRVPAALLQLGLGALVLLGMAVAAAFWLSRRIVVSVSSLKVAAARMKSGQKVAYEPTGIVECNEVAQALADASGALRHASDDLGRQVTSAVALARDAEQRVSQHQRVEALGRLTGAVAHDFNNLLGVISNSAYLIQRRGEGPELQSPVAAILRSVEVGSRMTQHLLRFAGRHPAQPEAIELRSYLHDAQELLQIVAGKSIKTTVTVAPDIRKITMDPNELELALMNLVLNARDAMPNGGNIWIEARNAAGEETANMAPGPHVLIGVTDDGAGMDAALAGRVFEPFFSTKSAGGGTGLGLSQVYGLSVQAGGIARVASTPGLGTTVSMVVPAGDEVAPLAAGPDDQAAGISPSGAGGPGMKVLLVEDNDELADVTVVLLGVYGCRVVRAGDPTQAFALLRESPGFDVVLSDIAMPGDMDGLEFARRLRQQRPTLPVVLISGFSEAIPSQEEFVVLRKPCAPPDLLKALQAAVEKSRSQL